jgi:EAL domain-containing protein (putative c-di-GMP-specific phosphodiesterase class I)
VVRETSTQANRFHHELARFDTPWFANALDQDRFVYHLQPIVDVYNVQAYAYEGLIRLFSDRAYSGGEIIAAAQQRAVLRQFDTYSRIRAIRSIAPQLPAGVKVFVNFLPARIYNPDYCLQSTLLAVDELGIPHSSIVFEAVQSGQIRNIPDLLKIRDFFGKHGFGFALDNASVSQQSLDTLQAVIPDFIKLDMSLSSELSGTAQQNATRALIESARSTGVEVIAEGVETVVQARFLRRLGVRLMQGWYWGKPGPLVLKDSAELAPLCAAVNHPEPQSTSRDSSPGTTHSPDPPLVFA